MRSAYRLLIPVIALLALNGCALFGFSSAPQEHTVQRGDTLYSIAADYDVDYRELAAWNSIKPPYRIRIGQILLVEPPDDFVYAPTSEPTRPKDPASEPGAVNTTPLPSDSGVSVTESPGEPQPPLSPAAPAPVAPPPPVGPIATAPPPSAVKWRWPAEGELIPGETGGSPGIDIAGQLGQSVRAAAGGKVVYSGGGLQGYGQLVIVKHEGNYLTAYGYNRRLLVRQGDEVYVGQPIAEMGEGPQRRPVLHFEIRRSGKALDPLQLLPGR